jgi:Tol biopolymer transport system component
MRRVIWRILGAAALALLLASGVAMAAAPAGPRLAVVRLTEKRSELLTVNPNGGRPDGNTLAFTRFTGGEAAIWTVDLTSGVQHQLTPSRRGLAYVGSSFSPDGSKISVFREVGRRPTSDLFVLNVASGSLRRLTRTPHKEELFASWDPSGERIVFARSPRHRLESPNSIVEINADGTCETEVLSQKRTVFYAPAWQPGPGREAGPIEC